jgi:alkylation response protein AidB-like acyl-CoA dehydrogenase
MNDLPEWTPAVLRERLQAMLRCDELTLPLPGSGETARRHRALFEFGLSDLSLARLIEAHTDAVAILAEAGRSPVQGALYGVWASDGPGSQLQVRAEDGREGFRLAGSKQFCSGAGIVDRALVTAHDGPGIRLFDVSLDLPGVSIAGSDWATPAFAATCTARVDFDEVVVHTSVGEANWYLQRIGFWDGAIGPAACWAGGAAGLVDAATAYSSKDPHTRAHQGGLSALKWALLAYLDQAAAEIDTHVGTYEDAHRRALMVRHLIERACTEICDRFGRATGPRLLAFDALIARRHSELLLYIRQCHAERDLAALPASISDLSA